MMPVEKNTHHPENEDLTGFETQLRAAAPQPSAAFRARVTREIHTALQPQASRAALPETRFITQPWLRSAAIMAAVLIITGVAVAIGPWLLALLAGDAGLLSVYEAEQGIALDQQQTVDGYTVGLEWAYADHNRLTIAYTISGPPDDVFTNFNAIHHISTLVASSGGPPMSLPFSNGRGGVGIETGTAGYVEVYDMASFTPQADTLDLEWMLYIESVTEAARATYPDPSAADAVWWTGPYGPFHFRFSLPLTTDQRVANLDQVASDQGIEITLKQVVVTASQVWLRLCYAPPDPGRTWTLLPDLMAGETAVTGGGAAQTETTQTGSETCTILTYDAAMHAYNGPWTLTISELVGFGSGGGSDQQRIAGAWRFAFTLPE